MRLLSSFTVVLYAIFFIVALILFGYMHEEAHMAVYKGYGIKSHFEIRFPDFATVADKPCPNDYCELANNINEDFSYPMIIFFMLVGVSVFFLLIELNILNAKLDLIYFDDKPKYNSQTGEKL